VNGKRRLRWARTVERKGKKNEFRFSLGKLREADHLEELDVDVKIILGRCERNRME
jgi:hypothetical protein